MARKGKSQPRSRYGSRPLKRVVVKEEFVALTGDHEKALILAQIEYWHARPQEIDKYIHEELDRARRSGADITHAIQPTQGWIYKDAEELIEETMLSISRQTMRRRLKDLVDSGWVLQRNNPHHTWDQTLQYRLDLLKIRDDLRNIGYELQGWVLDAEEEADSDEEFEDDEPGEQHESGGADDVAESRMDIAESNLDIGKSRMIFRMSTLDIQMLRDGRAIPENTSETTTERDLPSVDPSARDTPARDTPAHESSLAANGTGPTDRLTDGSTDEQRSIGNDSNGNSEQHSDSPKAATQLLEEPHLPQSGTTDLSPKEGADNATLKPEEELRQQAEAIPHSEVSEEARNMAFSVLDVLPWMPQHDASRVVRLAEHYHQQQRSSVLVDAAQKVASRSEQTRIDNPWRYLTKTCAEKESFYSKEDEDLLASLPGKDETSSPSEGEASQSSGYEWFFDDDGVGESETDAGESRGESQHRQHTPEPDPEAGRVWEKVLEDVSGEINAPSLSVWFEGTIPISLSEERLTVSVPNGFAKEYIESRFKDLLEDALEKRLSPASSLEIVVVTEGCTDNTDRRPTS